MANLTHFEIPADKPGRAAKFYSSVFGWKITKWGKQEEGNIFGALQPDKKTKMV